MKIVVSESDPVLDVLFARSNDENRSNLRNVLIGKAFSEYCLMATNGRVLAGAPISKKFLKKIPAGVYSVKRRRLPEYTFEVALKLTPQDAKYPKNGIFAYIARAEKLKNDTDSPLFRVESIAAEYQLKAALYGKYELVNPAIVDFMPISAVPYDVYEIPEPNGQHAATLFYSPKIWAIAMGLSETRKKINRILDDYKPLAGERMSKKYQIGRTLNSLKNIAKKLKKESEGGNE